jgi:hypothetical protein
MAAYMRRRRTLAAWRRNLRLKSFRAEVQSPELDEITRIWRELGGPKPPHSSWEATIEAMMK